MDGGLHGTEAQPVLLLAGVAEKVDDGRRKYGVCLFPVLERIAIAFESKLVGAARSDIAFAVDSLDVIALSPADGMLSPVSYAALLVDHICGSERSGGYVDGGRGAHSPEVLF